MALLRRVLVFATVLAAMMTPTVATAHPRSSEPVVSRLASGLQGSTGSTVGPDGALYVTEATAGRVTRIDPRTGATTTFASGLPTPIIGVGGAMDVAFLGRTAYVLVTLVDSTLGGSNIDGIYRVDGPNTFTVVADIGQFASANPPDTDFDVPTGLQYAFQPYRGGFLVTDGHHNRVYRVTLDGRVRELIAFGNIVPTGLDVRGRTVYMAEAGPVPHLPETGRIVRFGPRSETATEVAAGARLLVDVEFGRGQRLYALSQGVFGGGDPGAPALPDTGALVKIDRGGTFSTVVDGLDRPTSLEFIRNTAYVVTMAGEVLKIANVSDPRPHGRR
jgi:sugar lactone lactonase YvrE